MDTKAAIRSNLRLSKMATEMLLADLSDTDLMTRVVPGVKVVLAGSHEMMHAGQITPAPRKLGKPHAF